MYFDTKSYLKSNRNHTKQARKISTHCEYMLITVYILCIFIFFDKHVLIFILFL
jgi:hypothetical protein